MFVAIGLLIPIIFHATGLGKIFLPMFWSVAACAFFLPISYAILVGALTPVVSTLFTGMPPPPIIYIMIVELPLLSGSTCLLYKKTRLGLFWALLIGMLISRTSIILYAVILAPILNLPPELISLAALIESIPGTIALLVIVPVLINRIKHEVLFITRNDHVKSS